MNGAAPASPLRMRLASATPRLAPRRRRRVGRTGAPHTGGL
jgi:hypothetical protein